MAASASPQSRMVAAEIDEPVPILFWDPPEFVVAMTLIGIGVMVNPLLGIIGGWAVLSQAPKLKRGAKKGAVQHILFSMGVPVDKNFPFLFPDPWIYDFYE